jgi:mono/diheme cytochrome c family protein
MRPLPALAFSLATIAAASAATGAFATVLQRRAAAVSHRQPPYVAPAVVATLPPEQVLARGRKLFLASCARCHGADARGDDGPDLHGIAVSDRRIAIVVTRGIKGEMPSFAKKHDAADIAALIAYVRSLD